MSAPHDPDHSGPAYHREVMPTEPRGIARTVESSPTFLRQNLAPQKREMESREPFVAFRDRDPGLAAEEDSDSAASPSPSDTEDRRETWGRFSYRKSELAARLAEGPSKVRPESLDAIKARLAELEHLEDANVKQYEKLKSKRVRKDERIKRRREEENRRRSAIDAARARKDDRIRERRILEDAAFQKTERALDAEESDLRYKLKCLKRGRPIEEYTQNGRNNISSASASPPMPQPFPSSLPPAKRHQTRPPSQTVPSTMAQPQQRPQQTAQPNYPPYQFYQTSNSPYPSPYRYAPNQSSHAPVPLTTHNTLPHNGQAPNGAHPLSHPPTLNSHPPFEYQYAQSQSQPQPQSQPHPQSQPQPQLQSHSQPQSQPQLQPQSQPHPQPQVQSQAPPQPQPQPQPNPPQQNAPPGIPEQRNGRSPPSAASVLQNGPSPYDIRPPQTSSFAAINQPSAGFAPINQNRIPSSSTSPMQPASDVKSVPQHAPKAEPVAAVEKSVHLSPAHLPSNTPTPTPTAAVLSGGKRTPSTTHPYSMSEAFANRHHHCERVDSLNRGIWTFHGPGGTKEQPTGPEIEMYLRCDQDSCKRIDWRTVHGLQCHIVKNHEQPKGTIGSLEKALERYGVAVTEIEEFEKQHGMGSGGTIADPKNTKVKSKAPSTESIPRIKRPPSTAARETKAIAQPRPSITPLMFPNLTTRGPSGGFVQDDIVYSDEDSDEEGESSVPLTRNKFEELRASVVDEKPPQNIVSDDDEPKKSNDPAVTTQTAVTISPVNPPSIVSHDTNGNTRPPSANRETRPAGQEGEEKSGQEDQEHLVPKQEEIQKEPSLLNGKIGLEETDMTSGQKMQKPWEDVNDGTRTPTEVKRPFTRSPSISKRSLRTMSYNKAQSELQGNDDMGDEQEDDSVVVGVRSPPKRTSNGRFVKKVTPLRNGPGWEKLGTMSPGGAKDRGDGIEDGA